MGTVAENHFNAYIDAFNVLMINNLQIRRVEPLKVRWKFVSNFKKSCRQYLSNATEKIYIYTRLETTSEGIGNVLLDFTISFDNNYDIPVLHFRIFEVIEENDFEEIIALLSIEDIYKKYGMLLGMSENALSAVSLDIHPLIEDQAVWFFVHACEVQDNLLTVMDTTLNEPQLSAVGAMLYMCAWFGMHGLGSIFSSISLRPDLHLLKKITTT